MTTPTDARAEFAAAYVDRGFRLQEVCSILGIEPVRALELLMDPETGAHLKRLAETGALASSLPDARRVLEGYAYSAMMEIPEFIQICRDNKIDPERQSIPAFLKAKTGANMLFQKAAHPSLMDLFSEAVKILKARGQKPDHAVLRKQIAQAVQDVLDGKAKE